jgi:thiamine biosynthesis protein ThiS
MKITVNSKELNIDTAPNTFTVANLLDYLEINFKVVVEKNGELADKTEQVVEGDAIEIVRFVGGG